jgi:branched-chain amino acid transport system permease protein
MAVIAETAAARIPMGPILREAAIAALVALVLSGPMMGLQTADASGGQGLILIFRPGWVLWAVGIVFVGRLLLGFWWAHRAGRVRETPAVLKAAGAALARLATPFAFAGIGFAIVLPFLWFADRYVVDVATTVLIYVMLGWGLNIVVGLAGLLDLGYVAFYAVGAYSYALLSKTLGFSFWMLLPLSGILAAFWGILLGFPVLRLRGDYLAIVTLAFGEIIRLVLINWVAVTGGYAGISGIPRPTFFGIPFNASEEGFAAVFGLEFTPLYRTIFLY